MLYWLPWHGQSMVPLLTWLTMQPMCVQTALNALNSPAVGWVTTTLGPVKIVPLPTGMSLVAASAFAAGALLAAALLAALLGALLAAAGAPPCSRPRAARTAPAAGGDHAREAHQADAGQHATPGGQRVRLWFLCHYRSLFACVAAAAGGDAPVTASSCREKRGRRRLVQPLSL